VIDVARRKGKTLVDMKKLVQDRITFRQWTEDQTLQGNGDRRRRRRRFNLLQQTQWQNSFVCPIKLAELCKG
jgi:hypothetical protein